MLLQVAICVADFLCLASLLTAAVVWIAGRLEFELWGARFSADWGAGLFAAVAAIVALRVLFAGWARRRQARRGGLFAAPAVRKGLMSFLVVFALFLAFEFVLFLVGFEAPLPPILIQGAEYEAKADEPIMADRELIWRYKPSGVMHGQPINNIGFPDRQVDPVRRDGTIRVICMGDSCTADAVPPYPTMLHELLEDSPPTDSRWEAFHTAVHGYSVVQGLTLFSKTTRKLRPDVVTIYFGWNAHWDADHPDRVRMASLRNNPVTQVLAGLRRKRFFQLMTAALRPMLQSPPLRSAQKSGGGNVRVPPDDYEATLTELVEEIRGAGALPIILTAPRAPQMHLLLVERGHGPAMNVVLERHDRYVDITRRVARRCEVPLVDLAATFQNDSSPEDFYEDGIHLSHSGRRRVARAIYEKLQELYTNR